MSNRYIVSVFEDNVERFYVCSMVMLSPDGLFLVTEDSTEHRFPASDLITIKTVRSTGELSDHWDRR